jgi:hypothetical protein
MAQDLSAICAAVRELETNATDRNDLLIAPFNDGAREILSGWAHLRTMKNAERKE